MLLCKLDWRSSIFQTLLLQGAIPVSTVAGECVSGSLAPRFRAQSEQLGGQM